MRITSQTSTNEQSAETSRFYRRSVMAMAMIAVFSYVVAFVQADRGSVHYERYVSAFTECFEHVSGEGAANVDCNAIPAVRESLALHREAFSIGEPFLNLALSLSIAVLLSPVFRIFARILTDRVQVDRTLHGRA